MNVSDFDYELPAERIAQEPAPTRDGSRLLVLDRHTGRVDHRGFSDLPGLLRRGDLLVLNDTQVLPARIDGRKPTGGRVELLLLERTGGSDEAPFWDCLVRPSRSLRRGARVDLGRGLAAVVVERVEDRFTLRLEDRGGDPLRTVAEVGRMPLPPYIRRSAADPRAGLDRERYQTVFAREPGAIAAPTAGLHFTRALLDELRSQGVETTLVTLHVGIGTFLPVRSARVEEHRMQAERFALPPAAAEAVGRTRDRGGRVVAVGTTVVRTLEANAEERGTVRAGCGRSDLFIVPGHPFRVVDALVTNFHLPRSTLLMLVSAFAGRQNVLSAYREAVGQGYRFYSYGDAMFIG